MCKSKTAEVDKSETIETSNYGILNFSEDNLGTMGLVEILVIILLIMAIVMTWVYCVKKKKQRRMRELNSAMRDGLNTASYRPASLPLPLPMVQFQTPGTRVVSMQEPPSAPAQPVQPPATLGLWDQCR